MGLIPTKVRKLSWNLPISLLSKGFQIFQNYSQFVLDCTWLWREAFKAITSGAWENELTYCSSISCRTARSVRGSTAKKVTNNDKKYHHVRIVALSPIWHRCGPSPAKSFAFLRASPQVCPATHGGCIWHQNCCHRELCRHDPHSDQTCSLLAQRRRPARRQSPLNRRPI